MLKGIWMELILHLCKYQLICSGFVSFPWGRHRLSIFVVLFVDIDGEIRSISMVNVGEIKDVGPWKVMIGAGTAENRPAFSQAVGIDISAEMLRRKHTYLFTG